MNRLRISVLGLGLAVCAAASAQTPPGLAAPSLWYNPILMMDPVVQKELHVSKETASKAFSAMIQEAMKLMPLMMQKPNGTPTPQEIAKRQAEMTASTERMQKASVADLNTAQRQRLHELTLQSTGPMALLDPKVGAQIGLTHGQAATLQSKLSGIMSANTGNMGSMMAGGMGGLQAMQEKTRPAAEAALGSVLTPKQKLKWKALQGKPVKLTPLNKLMGGMAGMGG